ncbi:hypothetical protein C8R45DRAFT_839076, partial [Mycena sanguinolenta]
SCVAAPKWASNVRTLLEIGQGSNAYGAAIGLWWRFKQAAGFLGPKQDAAVRPVEVKGWVARARTGGPLPAIQSVKDFGSRYWSWWVSINPEWRVGAGKGPVQEGEGEWAELAGQTGPNGLLNALICLRWWRDELLQESAEWKRAVADVRWVLEKLW